MVIWRDVPVKSKFKGPHVREVGGKLLGGIYVSYGDIPVFRFNEITNKVEAVVNLRGNAYAARGRFCYRRRKK